MPDAAPHDRPPHEGLPKSLTEGVHDRLFRARTLILAGHIDHDLASLVIAQLLALATEGEDPITMVVNSPGGHVDSGDCIHDVVRFVRPHVRMIGSGWVGSAAALVYVAVPREDRFCLPNTRFLLHQPSGGTNGSASDMEIEAREILRMRERINGIFARQTGRSLQRIETDTRRNFWMDAEAAREYGLVGRIVQHAGEIG